MTDNPDVLKSIRKALWILVTCVSILALGGAAQLTSNLYWWWSKGKQKPEQNIRVVVAAKDIASGTLLQKQDIGLRAMPAAELPDHFVCIHMVTVLPGHTVLRDFKRGEPLDLEETQLWARSREPQHQPAR